mgnify:CR=1 FL=1
MATIEKANMLVNAMLEEETLGELSAVIVDELHMVCRSFGRTAASC